jgi:uncharacterized membrane protein
MATVTTRSPQSSADQPRRMSRLTIAILIITLIGLADASYLTYVHYAGFGALLCPGGHGGHSSCETVQSSPWAELDGIPVALLGLIGYVTLLVSLRLPGDIPRALGFGVALVGFGFSLYLTYREAYTIHAYCEWCLASAGCLAILTPLTAIRFLRAAPA